MARIGDGILRDWKNGDTISSDSYEQDREMLRIAINDNDDKIKELQEATGTGNGLAGRMDTAELDISNLDTLTTAHEGRIDSLELKEVAQDERLDDLEYNVVGVLQPQTFEDMEQTNVTFNQLKFGYVDEKLAPISKKTDGVISIAEFEHLVLNKGQVNEDWKDAFLAAVNAIKTNNQKLVFPSGIYQYSISPNWAVDDAQIISDGEVRLRYTGTDHAVVIDGVASVNANVWNMTFGRFIVECPATAKDGVYINRVHHSHFDLRVRGAGAGYAGINVLFTVCDTFNIEVSSNPEGWYQDARPSIGLRLSKFGEGLIPSYNTFVNPIIEHTVQGTKIEDSLGNIFHGGTMEGCLDNGLWLTDKAGLNKFYGTDFEVNSGMDIYCQGFENQFNGIDSTKVVDFSPTAKNNTIVGGSYKTIILEATSTQNLVDGVVYNRELFDGTNGTISDAGTNNRIVNARNMKAGTWHT